MLLFYLVIIEVFAITLNNVFIPIKRFFLYSRKIATSIIVFIYINKTISFFHFSSSLYNIPFLTASAFSAPATRFNNAKPKAKTAAGPLPVIN